MPEDYRKLGKLPPISVRFTVVSNERWHARTYDTEDTVRFYALRLHEIGARSCCSALSFRYFDELKREMKTPPSIMAISAQRGQYLRRVDAEDLTDRRHRATRPRFCTPGYSSRSPENDVKCDLVDPGVLAADCLGEV